MVAASDVLCGRPAPGGTRWAAVALLVVGVLGWLVLGYGVPIGMVVATRHHLGQATGFSWLSALGGGEAWVALALWLVTFAAMLHAGLRRLAVDRRRRRALNPR